MFRSIVVILVLLILCGCATTKQVGHSPKDATRGLVYINNKQGATAVYIDGEFVGSTPISVSLLQGERHITMNYGGRIVLDTTLVVTDDFERNGNAIMMGGAVGGFATILLVPFPLNMLVSMVPIVFAGGAAQMNADKVVISSRDGIDASARPLPRAPDTLPAPVSAATAAPAAATNQSGMNMYAIDSDKYTFLMEKRGEKVSKFVSASYVCYETSSDLVWMSAAQNQQSVVYASDEFLPCEIDSLPYPSPNLSALKWVGGMTAAWGVIGAVAGGEMKSTLACMGVGLAFFGLPTYIITHKVAESQNMRTCRLLRNQEQVREWYRRYPCH
ncbi:MAG: PEGA domain-containing protein [Fibrobacter sp.]|nr:PEGA domain-containing protein [Fibrobacter sp.]